MGLISKLFHHRLRLGDGLSELLVGYSQSAASHQEDEVWALLGINNAAETDDLQPNYKKSFQEVFREATLYTLRCGSFSLLTMAGICSEKREGSSTWVVDLERPTVLYPLENPLSTYRAGGTEFDSGCIHRLDDKTIMIDGFVVDKVQSVAQSASGPGHGLGWQEILKPGFDSYPHLRQMPRHVLARHLEVYNIAETHLPDIYDKTQPPQSRLEAVWRTLIGDEMPNPNPTELITSWLRPAKDSIRVDYITHMASLRICARGMGFTPGNPEASSRYQHVMGRKIGVRQFAVTERGYMSLVPPGTQKGDCLAVFLGARTPHGLRRVDDGRCAYSLFGDAYVHGLMDGEVLHLGVTRQGIVPI